MLQQPCASRRMREKPRENGEIDNVQQHLQSTIVCVRLALPLLSFPFPPRGPSFDDRYGDFTTRYAGLGQACQVPDGRTAQRRGEIWCANIGEPASVSSGAAIPAPEEGGTLFQALPFIANQSLSKVRVLWSFDESEVGEDRTKQGGRILCFPVRWAKVEAGS